MRGRYQGDMGSSVIWVWCWLYLKIKYIIYRCILYTVCMMRWRVSGRAAPRVSSATYHVLQNRQYNQETAQCARLWRDCHSIASMPRLSHADCQTANGIIGNRAWPVSGLLIALCQYRPTANGSCRLARQPIGLAPPRVPSWGKGHARVRRLARVRARLSRMRVCPRVCVCASARAWGWGGAGAGARVTVTGTTRKQFLFFGHPQTKFIFL
jgi:hypothetical protein